MSGLVPMASFTKSIVCDLLDKEAIEKEEKRLRDSEIKRESV